MKRSLNSIQKVFTKLQRTFKNKKRTKFKKRSLFKCLFKVLLTISLNCKDMVETYYIKGVQKQPFSDDLQNRCS